MSTAHSEPRPGPEDDVDGGAARAGEAHGVPAEALGGESAGPQPMVSTFLRLPAYIVDRLKDEAAREGIPAVVLIRRVLEDHARGVSDELRAIRRQLERVERSVTRG